MVILEYAENSPKPLGRGQLALLWTAHLFIGGCGVLFLVPYFNEAVFHTYPDEAMLVFYASGIVVTSVILWIILAAQARRVRRKRPPIPFKLLLGLASVLGLGAFLFGLAVAYLFMSLAAAAAR